MSKSMMKAWLAVGLMGASLSAWSCGDESCPRRQALKSASGVLTSGSPTVGELQVKCGNDPVPPAPVFSEELDSENQRIAQHPWDQTRGRPDCNAPGAKDPKFEVLEVNPGYFILRQNKCTNFEAPFIYLMLGPDGAFMHDTGAGGEGVNEELLSIVNRIVGDRPLTVGHGHGHGDHTHGDSVFRNRPNTRVVGTGRQAVAAAYGMTNWPEGTGQIDLGGGRIIDVIAIPGHADDSVAFYDRQTRDMLTGDSLYPGNVFVSSPGSFAASNRRLWEFARRNPVRNVLGSHIEMTARPGVDIDYGSTDHSASEHSLALRERHLCQLAYGSSRGGQAPTRLDGSAVPGCDAPYSAKEVERLSQLEVAAGRPAISPGRVRFADFLVP